MSAESPQAVESNALDKPRHRSQPEKHASTNRHRPPHRSSTRSAPRRSSCTHACWSSNCRGRSRSRGRTGRRRHRMKHAVRRRRMHPVALAVVPDRDRRCRSLASRPRAPHGAKARPIHKPACRKARVKHTHVDRDRRRKRRYRGRSVSVARRRVHRDDAACLARDFERSYANRDAFDQDQRPREAQARERAARARERHLSRSRPREEHAT